MGLNLKNKRVEQLAEEVARITGETKTAAILRALEERRERIVSRPSGERRFEQALDFLEKEIWPTIPRNLLGRRIPRRDRERILGYGKDGV